MIPMKMHFGVIENVDDPLRLGRCKVRVIGIHTEDKTVLRTDDLPWATPIQNVTSAALSGIGISPTGILNGSTVIVIFADGDACQVPLILGTIAGIPQGQASEQIIGDTPAQPVYQTGDTSPPVKDNNQPLKTVEQGGGFKSPPPEPSAGELGPMNSDQYIKYREKIAEKESGRNYTKINTLNYMGKYQFGAAALTDLGYVKKGFSNKDLKNDSAWTGKDGVTSYTKFLEKTSVQDQCMKTFTNNNYKILRNKGVLRNDSDANHCAGLLAVAHLKGAGDAIKFGRGEPVKPDAYGTSPEKYYKEGYGCIDGKMPTAMPTDDSSLPISEAKQTTSKGFSDPNAEWPRKKYLNEPDTSRLSRAQGISETIVGKKEASRTRHIRVANSETTWDQPHIPYASIYPHNKVLTTENGLAQEFDDTIGAIRYHLYHPTGTFTEIDNNGTTVNKIIGDKFEIIERNGYVYVKGDCNITVEGNANILVQEKCELEVYGDCDAVFKNNLNTTVHGTMNTFVQEDVNIKCRSFNVSTFNGDINMTSAKNIKTKSVDETYIESGKDFKIKSDQSGSINCTEDIIIDAESNIFTKSGSDINIKSGAILALQSGSTAGIKSGGTLGLDGTTIKMQEGASPTASTQDVPNIESAIANSGGSSITDPINNGLVRQEVIDSNIAQISDPPSHIDNVQGIYESPDDGEISSSYKEKIAETLIGVGEIEMAQNVGKNTATASQEFSGSNNLTSKSIDCSAFLNEEDIPMGLQLSENYSLKQFCSSQLAPKKLVSQHGISPGQLVCNLKHLAINIVEEVRKHYPEVKITSALRYGGAGQIMDASKKTISQHEKGMAVDLQFGPQYNASQYFDIAKDLAGKLDYDQIILEYSNNFKSFWVHVSFNPNGNRKELYTYNNHAKVSNSLSKLV